MKVAFLGGMIVAFIISTVVTEMPIFILFAIISSMPFFYITTFKPKKEESKNET